MKRNVVVNNNFLYYTLFKPYPIFRPKRSKHYFYPTVLTKRHVWCLWFISIKHSVPHECTVSFLQLCLFIILDMSGIRINFILINETQNTIQSHNKNCNVIPSQLWMEPDMVPAKVHSANYFPQKCVSSCW